MSATQSFNGEEEMNEAATAVLAITERIEEVEESHQENNSAVAISHQDALTQVISSYNFTCDICQGKFSDQFSFFSHLKNHYDSQPAPSAPIPVVVASEPSNPETQPTPMKRRKSNKSSAVAVVDVHDDLLTNSYACLTCGKEFKRRHTLNAHLKIVHGRDSENLDDAVAVISHDSKQDEPQESHGLAYDNEVILEMQEEESEMIDIKNEASSTEVELEQDEITYVLTNETLTKPDEESAAQCTRCGDLFETRESLAQHGKDEHGVEQDLPETEGKGKAGKSREGKDTLKCSECDRVFNHRNSLVYHMRSHTGERPHMCDLCGKSFFATSALKVHMRLHSGEKPYNCQHCGRSFRQWGDLTYHVISIHSDVRQYQCEFCGKDFARKYSLVVHRRIHTGERNYKCEFCDKCFRAASYLQNHRRIHTGEKPHDCTICGKPFRVRSDMKRHMSSHTREKGRTATESDDNGHVSENEPSQPKASGSASITKTKLAKKVSTRSVSKKKPASTNISVQNIVAMNEAGEIVALEPELALQLQAGGQLIHVPASGASGSITLTRSNVRTLSSEGDTAGILITGDVDNDQDVSLQVEDAVTEIKDELIYEDGQEVTISQGNLCDANSGTLYVWPVFMS